jgi:eukaryotic-like serine/threonine-protein kinase
MMERIGQQIGNYQLIHHIGQGGFADVYMGQHISDKTQVAIKVLHENLTYEEIKKFLEQAHTLSHLNHPHIIRILDFGMEEHTPFLVMDYAPYGTLRQHYPKGTQLPLSTVVTYVKSLADALQYIHDHGFIHRDIKPHNMLIGPQHQIMLSDFGTAVVAESMGYRRQKIQEFEGTILYAAPEQIRGKPRISSDQYALGIVIYEWLTGSWPFYGTVEEIASQHTLTSPAPLSQKVPTLPLAVEQVVLKALAKDPYERFESIQALAKALERASRLEQTSHRISQPLTPLPTPIPLTSEEKRDLPPTETPLLTYQGHSDKIHMLAWSPDGRYLASSSLDETIQIWDALTGTTVSTHCGNSLQPQALAWSPDSPLLAFTSGLACEIIQICDISTGHISTKHPIYSDHAESIQALAWSPDGHFLASASEDKTVRIWNVTTGRVIFVYRGHSAPVIDVIWSPDGRRLASASEDKTAQAWNATTGSNIAVFYGHRDKVNAVTYSPGNTLIASASDDTTVQVWDSSTGRKVLIYRDHTGGASSAAWSPNGTSIASSSLDETVHVWNALTGTTLFTYTGHTDWVSTIAWSPDGQRIASGSWDKTVQVWEVKSINSPGK